MQNLGDQLSIAEGPLVSVVDDDVSVRESVPDLLRQHGYRAQAYSSAEAFLASDCIDSTRCLILDVAMRDMTGLELQRKLSARQQAIPIVFITAHADPSIRSRVIAHGAVACLFKPFTETALLQALDSALRRA